MMSYVSKTSQKLEVEKKRSAMFPHYEPFTALDKHAGSFDLWEKKISETDSTIGIILGARGTGKTACGVKLLENLYAQTKKKCYAIGFRKEEMPSWITVIENLSEIKNSSFVLIDEGGVLFSARRAMTSANKLLSDLLLISRHKNISTVFISQNSSNLDVNIIRQADYLILKRSSLLQKDFERKRIQELYDKLEKEFKKLESRKGLAYIYSDVFNGFVDNPLPSFWSERMGKSFR